MAAIATTITIITITAEIPTLTKEARVSGPFFMGSSFRDGPKDQTSDALLRIGEDSGFALSRAPE
jgi:hypothetical protein